MARRLYLLSALVAVLAPLVLAGSAAPAQTGFGPKPLYFQCFALTARLPSSGTSFAGAAANGLGGVCRADSVRFPRLSIDGVMPARAMTIGSIGTIGPARARTSVIRSRAGVVIGASATTTLSALHLSIPTVAPSQNPDAPHVTVVVSGPVTATAEARCAAGRLVRTVSSTLRAVTVNGHRIAITRRNQQIVLPHGVGTITANSRGSDQFIQPMTGFFHSDDRFQLISIRLDAIPFDAFIQGPSMSVSTAGPVCNRPPRSGTEQRMPGIDPPGCNPMRRLSSGRCACPPGATMRPRGCVVSGTAIRVPSVAFILGGRVMSLAAARRRFGPRTPCLSGPGPRYVVVGIKNPPVGGLYLVNTRVRTLALGGNDNVLFVGGAGGCANLGAGNDRFRMQLNRPVTVFGGPGNDDIQIADGPAKLNGGPGGDIIQAGWGRVRINGGSGRNYLYASSPSARVRAAPQSNTRAYVDQRAAAFARNHGVRHVLVGTSG